MLDNKKAGKNILALRKGASLTQSALSNLLGVSHQAVSKWEQGECLPDIEVLLKLGQVFNKSVEEILLSERVTSDSVIMEDVNPPNGTSEQLDIWTKALIKIKSQMDIRSFDTWFENTKAEYVEGTFIIYSPIDFATEWLHSRYSKLVLQILEETTGESYVKVEFRTMDNRVPPNKQKATIRKYEYKVESGSMDKQVRARWLY
ncbi:helix-turn-helix domain-containing protein [Paenibacillus methanolicus]|uniref:DNA-binding XRE family transcriptional regulator n=1 Tax=Paenibacillus methanolicus TaxID=582686 RepID=A0A5S5C1G4_9BACL|nr:helix-turn-helix transcriptional regulator [Paenibacillus methanolicus]TYP73275.1 DNA-binding XRE family transcriptional regulator [Paenibacillus methanolicus]